MAAPQKTVASASAVLNASSSAPATPLVSGLSVLIAHKQHSIGLIAGTGPSSGRLSERQSAILQRSMDVWGLNQLVMHASLTPRFHHLELKQINRSVSNAQLWAVSCGYDVGGGS